MKKIIIVGVGALGSHVAMMLRNVAQLKLIDHDRVEAKNTLSQFHGKPSLGKNKAQALQQSLQFMFGLKTEVIPHRLVSANTEILNGYDLVLDCLDNGASRRLVQAHVRAKQTPCLHGALAAGGAFGRVVWDEAFEVDDETPGVPTCEDGGQLPFICVVSSLLARAAQEFLKSGKKTGYEINPRGVIST